ncbi:hypothetical protein [Phyllobacterium lublinensis]|uniref:hypothetical protein n=1 Tax=Phyllobacterium lublinensis TaxID=2875708 RepID=UPI001CCF0AFE|nr:hypothetical protein [Phyllobacterium sp. 2063]MBZ9653555.1 hypothetical protein [Phyllobacterium sp. 2063]
MTNRVLIGDFGGGDYRLRGSKPGYDVTGALDPERLAFDSAWTDTAVIYMKGLVAVPSTPPSGFVQINFGETLPAVPFVICFRKIAGNAYRMGSDDSTATVYRPYFYTVTTTYIRFWQNESPTGGGGNAYTAGYLILRSIV